MARAMLLVAVVVLAVASLTSAQDVVGPVYCAAHLSCDACVNANTDV